MATGPLRRRSSWPSSFATALIGWNGFAVIMPLALGYQGQLGGLLSVASTAAVAEVLVLRVLFRALRMDRSLVTGAIWGTVTSALLGWLAITRIDLLRQHPVATLLGAVYAGLPVGVFLSYFHCDDRKIEAEARAAGRPVDYGRDAHWLDPFLFGAVAYVVAFVPLSPALGLSVAVVGCITGVVAAGISHFILSRWGNAPWTVAVAAVAGAPIGAGTGLLFRHHGAELRLPYLAAGAIAGALTFLVTAAVGRVLARREAETETR